VISVDTKKKESVGNYKNAGHEWRREGDPVRVRTHDFPDANLGKAIPYGIYDLTADTGWVNVGTDHDTAAFAVASVRRWWHAVGRDAYPRSHRLLITADTGGYRPVQPPIYDDRGMTDGRMGTGRRPRLAVVAVARRQPLRESLRRQRAQLPQP
jgi:hypothetical protein